MDAQARPRILCVRPTTNEIVSPLLVELGGEWVEALALHAEVCTVRGAFDLAALCASFGPDLIIFEAMEFARPWFGAIDNLDAHPEIPRVLLLNCDPHNPLRPVIYGLRPEHRFEAVFQFGVEHSQLMPDLAYLDCFSLPLFIDSAVFHDDGSAKQIPMTIFSANLMPDFYSWRARLVEEAPLRFPTLLYPHPGYTAANGNSFAVRNRDYAHLLTMSYFAAADTTRLDYVVRKHLEIPAAGAVLVAPQSEALADYGFRDLQNCVLGSGDELFGKIARVMREPGLYDAIRSAGTALVQARFTRQSWTPILDWLACRRQLKPGQAVRQERPLGPFQAVDRAPPVSDHARGADRDNEVTAVLRRARRAILSGQGTAAAVAELPGVTGWLAHMMEPWLLLGVSALAHGQPEQAIRNFTRRSGAFVQLGPAHQRFDPVELAWLQVAAHLGGLTDVLDELRQRAEGIDHLSLRRVRWLFRAEPSESSDDADLHARRPGDALSMHWLGQEPFDAWCGLIARIFAANGEESRLPVHLLARSAGQTAAAEAA